MCTTAATVFFVRIDVDSCTKSLCNSCSSVPGVSLHFLLKTHLQSLQWCQLWFHVLANIFCLFFHPPIKHADLLICLPRVDHTNRLSLIFLLSTRRSAFVGRRWVELYMLGLENGRFCVFLCLLFLFFFLFFFGGSVDPFNKPKLGDCFLHFFGWHEKHIWLADHLWQKPSLWEFSHLLSKQEDLCFKL